MTNISEEDWFQMDECMKPLIKLLNKRGYETKYCCSGHPKQAIWKYPIISQEEYYNMKYQFGARRKHFEYSSAGYIMFKRMKDRDFILKELKKTKYAERFLNYQGFCRNELPIQENKWFRRLDKIWLEFRIRGLTQRDINKAWIDINNKLKGIKYKI